MESEPQLNRARTPFFCILYYCVQQRGDSSPISKYTGLWRLLDKQNRRYEKIFNNYFKSNEQVHKTFSSRFFGVKFLYNYRLWCIIFEVLQLVTTTIYLQTLPKLTSRTICPRAALTELIFRKDCPVLLRDPTGVTRPAPLKKLDQFKTGNFYRSCLTQA